MSFINRAIGKLDELQPKHDRPSVTTLSDRTARLLQTYMMNVDHLGVDAVRELILDDIRSFTELGAHAYVADLTKVLFRLDDESALISTYSRAFYHPAQSEWLEVGM